MESVHRKDFPLLNVTDVVYVDNAATTQKPQRVIDSMNTFYTRFNAPVHRGFYGLAEEATKAFEQVRQQVCSWVGALEKCEIVFTRGTTESINALTYAWARSHLKKGDEIVVSELEHHANLLPWQRCARECGCTLSFIPILPDGELDYAAIDRVITKKTKLVSVTAGSNVVGIPVNLKPIIARAKAVGALIAVDAAQAIPFERFNVTELGIDFLAFSGHKMLAPTGIGVLYIQKELHAQLEPFLLGGSMVLSADWHDAVWQPMPALLEAGTPAIAEVIGLGAALDYMESVDFKWLASHLAALCSRFIDGVQGLQGVRILGPLDKLKTQGHLVSFVIDELNALDLAAYFDREKIAVRAGHHCAQPLHNKLGVPQSVRVSFHCYNTSQEVDQIIDAMRRLLK